MVIHTVLENVQEERGVCNVLILPNSPWVLMISRNGEMCIAEQSWSKCGLTVISACLPWKVIWQLDRTVWNLFLEDKFLFWLAPAFGLFLLPAWNSWGNSNFPRTIDSIVWWAIGRGTNISLEYLHSTRIITPVHALHRVQAGPLQPMAPWLWLKYRVHSCCSSEEVCHCRSPHAIHSVLTTPRA